MNVRFQICMALCEEVIPKDPKKKTSSCNLKEIQEQIMDKISAEKIMTPFLKPNEPQTGDLSISDDTIEHGECSQQWPACRIYPEGRAEQQPFKEVTKVFTRTSSELQVACEGQCL